MNNKLKFISQEYYRKFEKLKIRVPISNLQNLVTKEALKAEKNYHRLVEPRTCSLNTYVALWVREILEKKFILKTLKKVDSQNPRDSFVQSLSSFFYYLPQELIPHMRKNIFDAPFLKRKDIWQSFNLPLNEIENRFQKLIETRIKDLSERNYSPFFEVFLEKNKISQEVYTQFVKGVDKLIVDLNSQLPQIKDLPSWFYSEFNLPCFICQLPKFPFNSTAEVIDFIAKEYPIFKEFRQKVKIKPASDEKTFTIYRIKQDVIEISFGKEANIRHEVIVLIHELCHVVSLLTSLRKEKDTFYPENKYRAEIKAMEIETKLLKIISEPLYQAYLGEILLFPFRNTLFEIELYKNPRTDVSKLYAESFNRCFLKAKQKDNPLYLLDESIITKPFTLLPHAIARYQILKN